jgi:hypothetical protein
MLKFANVALEFLLEFRMRYLCLFLVKVSLTYLLLNFIFNEFALEYESFLLFLFDSILYIIYYNYT